MAELTKHWTEREVDDFLYRIASDFVRQIYKLLGTTETSQALLAKNLGVSQGRISQVLNNPGNLTLRQIIRYARALGRKVSIVAYDDSDPDNLNGPINADIFAICWEQAGKPVDFFALRDSEAESATRGFVIKTANGYRDASRYGLTGESLPYALDPLQDTASNQASSNRIRRRC